jgi:hypothetical protein
VGLVPQVGQAQHFVAAVAFKDSNLKFLIFS